jgi:hypothetical protein
MSAYTRLLEQQLAQTRKDLEFYRGKCERLEQALMPQTKPEPVVVRPIEATPIETKPAKKTWRETVSEWAKLTPEQQDEAMKKETV